MDGKLLLTAGAVMLCGFAGTWLAMTPAPSGGARAETGARMPAATAEAPAYGAMAARADNMDVYYPDCRAAWSAGAAPISEGMPGYRPEMDGDHDGIACEPHRSH